MRVYSQPIYNKPVHDRLFDICHLHGLRVAYPNHVLFWFDSYVQTIPNWHSNVVDPQHLPLEF
jgi:hypothetical protein